MGIIGKIRLALELRKAVNDARKAWVDAGVPLVAHPRVEDKALEELTEWKSRQPQGLTEQQMEAAYALAPMEVNAMKSWHTTLLGILSILSTVIGAGIALLNGSHVDPAVVIAGITAGAGLIAAKDANVTGGTVKQ